MAEIDEAVVKIAAPDETEKVEDKSTSSPSRVKEGNISIDISSHNHPPADSSAYTSLVDGVSDMSDTAALIAALGNKSSDPNIAALMAAGGGGGFGGNNMLGTIVALSLLGGRGGLGGWGGVGNGVNGCGTFTDPVVLNAIGDLKASVPLTACQTQQSVAAAAGELEDHISQNAIAAANYAAAGQLATATLSTTVQSGFAHEAAGRAADTAALTAAIVAQGQRAVDATTALSAKIDANTILDLQRQLGVAQLENQTAAINRGVEVNVTQITNQLQQQQQQIANLSNMNGLLFAELQRNTNSTVAIGSTIGRADQTATNTSVRG